MTAGRPFRFLGAVVGGWIGLRALLLWPASEIAPALARSREPVRLSAPVATSSGHAAAHMRSSAAFEHFMAVHPHQRAEARPPAAHASLGPMIIAAAMADQTVGASVRFEPNRQGALPPPLRVASPSASRWSGSVWAIGRPSGLGGGLDSSQLGGSQAGVRLAYALDSGRRLAVVGRIATPLEGRGREAALGVEWRPEGVPVRVFAEHRFALDKRGRGGPSAGVIGGLDERLAGGFRLEAYGQAGVIIRDQAEGFADGAARVTRRLTAIGSATVDVGAGAWGGAQRDAERLDIGPTLGVAVPVGGRALRVTLDYRARVAGRARPGSGPAISLGTDF